MRPKCATPLVLYDSRHAWFNHEMYEHFSVWRCSRDCNKLFGSRDLLKSHLIVAHGISLEDGLYSYLTAAVRRIPDITMEIMLACPICGEITSTLKVYRKHVGEHQRHLSLSTGPSVSGQSMLHNDRISSPGQLQDIDDSLYGTLPKDHNTSYPRFTGTHSSSLESDAPGEHPVASAPTLYPPLSNKKSIHNNDLSSRRHATREEAQVLQDIPHRHAVIERSSAEDHDGETRSILPISTRRTTHHSLVGHNDPAARAVVESVKPSYVVNDTRTAASGLTLVPPVLSIDHGSMNVLISNDSSSVKSESVESRKIISFPKHVAVDNPLTVADDLTHTFQVYDYKRIYPVHSKFHFAGKNDKHITCRWEVSSARDLEEAEDIIRSNPESLDTVSIPKVHRSLLDIDTLRSFRIPFSDDTVSVMRYLSTIWLI